MTKTAKKSPRNGYDGYKAEETVEYGKKSLEKAEEMRYYNPGYGNGYRGGYNGSYGMGYGRNYGSGYRGGGYGVDSYRDYWGAKRLIYLSIWFLVQFLRVEVVQSVLQL